MPTATLRSMPTATLRSMPTAWVPLRSMPTANAEGAANGGRGQPSETSSTSSIFRRIQIGENPLGVCRQRAPEIVVEKRGSTARPVSRRGERLQHRRAWFGTVEVEGNAVGEIRGSVRHRRRATHRLAVPSSCTLGLAVPKVHVPADFADGSGLDYNGIVVITATFATNSILVIQHK